MLGLKNIKMQANGERVIWDRAAVLSLSLDKENYNFPPSAVQYYIAGLKFCEICKKIIY